MKPMFNIDDPDLKKDPFRMPDGFREKSQKEIWDRISMEKNSSQNKRFYGSAAAAVAALFGLFFWANHFDLSLNLNNNTASTIDQVENEDILTYELYNLDEATLSSAINDSILDAEFDQASMGLETDEIVEYLQSIGISEYDLYATR